MPKQDDVVLVTILGRTVPAIVLSVRSGEVAYLGAQGEPLLTVAFRKQPAPNAPHKRPTVLQGETAEPEIQIERDVVHESHTFSAEYRKDKGLATDAHVAAARGHGEWRDAVVVDVRDALKQAGAAETAPDPEPAPDQDPAPAAASPAPAPQAQPQRITPTSKVTAKIV